VVEFSMTTLTKFIAESAGKIFFKIS